MKDAETADGEPGGSQEMKWVQAGHQETGLELAGCQVIWLELAGHQETGREPARNIRRHGGAEIPGGKRDETKKKQTSQSH